MKSVIMLSTLIGLMGIHGAWAGPLQLKARDISARFDEDTNTCTIHFTYCDGTTSTSVENQLRDADACYDWGNKLHDNREKCEDELQYYTIGEFIDVGYACLIRKPQYSDLFYDLTIGNPNFRLCIVKPKPAPTPAPMPTIP